MDPSSAASNPMQQSQAAFDRHQAQAQQRPPAPQQQPVHSPPIARQVPAQLSPGQQPTDSLPPPNHGALRAQANSIVSGILKPSFQAYQNTWSTMQAAVGQEIFRLTSEIQRLRNQLSTLQTQSAQERESFIHNVEQAENIKATSVAQRNEYLQKMQKAKDFVAHLQARIGDSQKREQTWQEEKRNMETQMEQLKVENAVLREELPKIREAVMLERQLVHQAEEKSATMGANAKDKIKAMEEQLRLANARVAAAEAKAETEADSASQTRGLAKEAQVKLDEEMSKRLAHETALNDYIIQRQQQDLAESKPDIQESTQSPLIRRKKQEKLDSSDTDSPILSLKPAPSSRRFKDEDPHDPPVIAFKEEGEETEEEVEEDIIATARKRRLLVRSGGANGKKRRVESPG